MRWIFLSSILLLSACSQAVKDLKTDVGTLAEGRRLKDNEFFEEARKQFFRIKTEFPQSPLQAEADLEVAHSYFNEENYSTAATSYEDFIKTYPGRPEVPDAIFQLGMCYANQMPSTPQRDTRPTSKALDTFTRLTLEYPSYAKTKEVQDWIGKARSQLASRLFEIGRFYEKQEKYESAAKRYGELANEYPDHPLAEEAMARRIRTLRMAGKKDLADPLATDFLNRYPNSQFKSSVEK